MNKSVQEQLTRFNQLWQETCDLWPPSGFTRNLQTSTKQDWNIIATTKEDSWKALTPIIEVIQEQWSWNIPYAQSQIHLTIVGLGHSIDWSQHQGELQSIVNDITKGEGPIKVDLHGINILRNTIIVQAIDTDGRLQHFVSKLSKQIKDKKIMRNFRPGTHGHLWWYSIIRLYKPIPDELRQLVATFRETNFGSLLIDKIDFCYNNKTFDTKQTYFSVNLNNMPGG